ncbi:S1/P1 nuclease [Aureivirga sp. CE67]|uniref:S1/P1 nuclease n=1 Tax=Aureivirga sp. CE67 TaxID=1788983 RepID=UPI0018C95D76|nr:S1/P1 nuclease [Aureivirga sp. CE67]
MFKKTILGLLGVIAISSFLAYKPYWGQTGHRTVGQIAEGYLKKSTKKHIKEILDGDGLALVSTYSDEIKSDRKYDDYKPWHYINFDDSDTYEASKKNPKGDLVVGINKCVEVLKDENASKADKAFHLKMLVHLVGDLHQPLHVGHSHDRGGNAIKVDWFWDKSNLHRVWDSEMIDSYQMSYTELAKNQKRLTSEQIDAIQKGSVIDWMYESKELAENVYASAKEGENLKYEYMYQYFPVVRTQLQKGGIRLAKILNETL